MKSITIEEMKTEINKRFDNNFVSTTWAAMVNSRVLVAGRLNVDLARLAR